MQVLKPHRTKFPKSYGFLDAELQRLPKGEPMVWAAFLKHAHLSDADARMAVAPGSSSPLIFAQDLGPVVWGQFDSDTPNRIEIAKEVLEKFELDSTNPDAKVFLRTKTLHEMCHWGCHRGKIPDPDVAGENFEVELFQGEIRAWFLAAPSVLTTPPADTAIFTDPGVRANALLAQITRPGFVAGREADPAHRIFGGADVAEGMPRGFRNNNPGNIRVGDPWTGLAPLDEQKSFQQLEKAFGVFREPEWGLRAIARLLRKYKSKGFDTPRKIIERWAPVSDGNNVDSYSGHLAEALGVNRDDVVDANDDDVAVKMMLAIATHENGSKPPYSQVQFKAALRLL